MSKLIEKIWNCEYNPAERHVVCLEEIREKTIIVENAEKKFLKGLTLEQQKEFDEILSKHCDLLDYLLLDAYTKGAKFVGGLLAEIIGNM